MASTVDIINMALTRLHLPTIGSLDDPTPQARLAAREFDNARDCVLRDFRWGFASRKTTPAPLAGSPDKGGTYAYPYPPDCLLVREVKVRDKAIPFEMADRGGLTVILAEVSPVDVHYTARVGNAERLDPIFVDALAWRLATLFATGVGSDMQKAQAANSMYETVLSRARVADAEEEEVEALRVSSYELGRW